MKINELLKNSIVNNTLSKPYIIAEIGVNHEGSMITAKKIIDQAKEGGAHAVKFQSYKAETLASKHSPAYWDTTKESTKSQFELFKKHDSFWKDEMQELKYYSDSIGIEFLSTPFDLESANFLNDMMDVFKISSSDITNKPFIEHICKFGKPIILSTGASDIQEIKDAVNWIKPFNVPLALLHCVLNYPTPDENANLGMIIGLKEAFPNTIIGYSDHTLPKNMRVCEMATLLGAKIIEKHFTNDKSLTGNDHYHAMDKEDLIIFNKNINNAFKIIGGFEVCALEDEEKSRLNARRSLVASRDIPKGKVIEKSDLTFKRPAHGVSPKDIDCILGKKALSNIDNDSIIKWSFISK
jgi:sialic acid synthase SpsE